MSTTRMSEVLETASPKRQRSEVSKSIDISPFKDGHKQAYEVCRKRTVEAANLPSDGRLSSEDTELLSKIVNSKFDLTNFSAEISQSVQLIESHLALFVSDPLHLKLMEDAHQAKYQKTVGTPTHQQYVMLEQCDAILKKYLLDVMPEEHKFSALITLKNEYMAWHQSCRGKIEKHKHAYQGFYDVFKVYNQIDMENVSKQDFTYMKEDVEILQGTVSREMTLLKKLLEKEIHPSCLSFALLKDKQKNKLICLFSISSPQENADLLKAMHTYFGKINHLNKIEFCFGEPTSTDFKKLLYFITSEISEKMPLKPMRECAEKSHFSMMAKWARENPLLEIELICNMAFRVLPVQSGEEGYFSVVLTENQKRGMKIIPSCHDCLSLLPAAELLVEQAKENNAVELSPIKKWRLMGRD